jgi:hypothetical protein
MGQNPSSSASWSTMAGMRWFGLIARNPGQVDCLRGWWRVRYAEAKAGGL